MSIIQLLFHSETHSNTYENKSLVKGSTCFAICYKKRLTRIVNKKCFIFQAVSTDKIGYHICSLLFFQATAGYANEKLYADAASNSRTFEIIINLLRIHLIEFINFQEFSNCSRKIVLK